MDIKNTINEYMNERKPYERYTSFDYCYNYFYKFYKENKIPELADTDNLQISCLQLGFYLASWGMMRSPLLINKSLKHLEELINVISKGNPMLWELDVNNYTDENIDMLFDFKKRIIKALKYNSIVPTDTMVTKIMLGVFGNVPAFDRFFINSCLGVKTFNKKSLMHLKDFYDDNKIVFDSLEYYTLDFDSCIETNIRYTNAKLIDMCGFIDGQK